MRLMDLFVKRCGAIALIVTCAAFLSVGQARAIQPGGWAWYSSGGATCSSNDWVDPIGVVFQGKEADAWNVNNHIRDHSHLVETPWDDEVYHQQELSVRTGPSQYGCRHDFYPELADHPDAPPSGRYHIRTWYIPDPIDPDVDRQTVGTPHHEDLEDCGHAIDRTGDEGSGFDKGRRRIRRMFIRAGHGVRDDTFGNDIPRHQCDDEWAASNGNGVVITVNHFEDPTRYGRVAPRTNSVQLKAYTSADASGSFAAEPEGVEEWWFEYGIRPDAEEEYPYETPHQYTSPSTQEVNVSAAITNLAPGTSYYISLVGRYPNGEVEVGNEVKFVTCDYSHREIDHGPGPYPLVECNKTVHVFYRTPYGTLGHRWHVPWAPGWGSEVLAGSVASEPQAVIDKDGGINVFYRTPSGTVGHNWFEVGGTSWGVADLGGLLAADAQPHAIVEPNKQVHVFYRTPYSTLGHKWHVPWESGWGSEVMEGSVASEPQAVVDKDGGINVFYRTPWGTLGHNWWEVGGTSWGVEDLGGLLAADAEPQTIVEPNKTIHVFYRTPYGTLGHRWHMPWVSGWGSEVLAGSLGSNAEPRPVVDQAGGINVFYRTPAGTLGHNWWEAGGTSWSVEDLGGSLASEPHAIVEPNKSVHVFYRTPYSTVGHRWHMSWASGWGSEVLQGSLASEPHAVVDKDGGINVFYRAPGGTLGHNWWESGGTSWSVENLGGLIAARPPVVTTNDAALLVNPKEAKLQAAVNPEGSPTQYYFEYGLTTTYDSRIPVADKAIGYGEQKVAVSETLTGLTPGTEYHYRIVATSPEGTVKGADKAFKTPPPIATQLGTMAVSQPFTGTSSSLANFNSNWGALGWASGRGEDTTTGWRPATVYPALGGAFSNIKPTDSGQGIAAVATLASSPGSAERHCSLWIDIASPSSTARNGYELRFTVVSTGTYNVTLSKWVGGTQTVLASKAGYALANGSSIGLVDQAGTVSAWVKSGSNFVQLLSASDSAFSGGNVGLQAAGETTRLFNFRAARLAPSDILEPNTTTEWALRNANSAGTADSVSTFGVAGVKEVAGDWNGDGVSTAGTYDPSTGTWKLRNSPGSGPADVVIQFGGGQWSTPVVGDWNGDGVTTPGLYKPDTGEWALSNTNLTGGGTVAFKFGGGGGWTSAVAGDWDGNGTDTIGLYSPSSGEWALRNSNSAGVGDMYSGFGGGGWTSAVAGDWDGNGTDTIGLYSPTTARFVLRNSNSTSVGSLQFLFGGGYWLNSAAGDWDGNGTDTIGVLSN
ncbi:MAG TPA: hypothetical protein VGG03_09805 [Thermoanaerobaculia bacterium]